MSNVVVAATVAIAALTAAALLQFALTRSGSIERNAMVGIKTSATLSSDAAWKAGHEAAQPALMAVVVTGSGALLTVLGLRLLAPDAQTAAVVIAAMGLLAVIGLFVRAARLANSAARAAN